MKAFKEFYKDLYPMEAFGIFFVFPLSFLLSGYAAFKVVSWILS